MSATIQVSRNFTSLVDLADPTADEMREIGLLMRERLIARTLAGMDAHGQPFAPYSPGYAEQKAQELGSAGVVNLQVSGAMLNDLTITAVEAEDGIGKVTLGWVR